MIILIVFYVVQWNMAILPKWLIISTLALVLTLAVYELLIRRVNGMRWFFSMKPCHRTSQQDVDGGGTQEHEAEAMGDKADQSVSLHTWKQDPSVDMNCQSDKRSLTG